MEITLRRLETKTERLGALTNENMQKLPVATRDPGPDLVRNYTSS
jgi:hypothetical protein